MQGSGGSRDPFSNFGDPFAGFGGFGGFGGRSSFLSSFFGGRDPFDDPFFTRPFGGMFESSIFGPTGNPFTEAHTSGLLEHQLPQRNKSRGPIIEELNSDDEKEGGGKEKKGNPRKHFRSSNESYVEEPDDEVEDELSGFQEEWKGNARNHPPGWREGFNVHEVSGMTGQNLPASRVGWALPLTEHPRHSGSVISDIGERAGPSRLQHLGRRKAGVLLRTGSSWGRPRSASAFNKGQGRRH